MPRIRLAHWHDGHAPGDVIEVDDDTCRALRRDGRVSEVLPDYAEGGVLPVAVSEVTNDTGEPVAVVPAPRKRKSAEPQEE